MSKPGLKRRLIVLNLEIKDLTKRIKKIEKSLMTTTHFPTDSLKKIIKKRQACVKNYNSLLKKSAKASNHEIRSAQKILFDAIHQEITAGNLQKLQLLTKKREQKTRQKMSLQTKLKEQQKTGQRDEYWDFDF